MTGNTSKAVLLSIHELLLLLYKREIEGMVFPDEIAEASANEFQLKSGMGELITDGYLVPGDDATYHISPEMDQILTIIGNASCTYVVMGAHLMLNTRYIYRHNNDAVQLSLDQRRKGWVRLEMGDPEDFIRDLTEYDFLPEEGLDSSVEGTIDDSVFETAEAGELMKSQYVTLVVEKYLKGHIGRSLRVCVTRETSQDRIISVGKTKEITAYDIETLLDKILEG